MSIGNHGRRSASPVNRSQVARIVFDNAAAMGIRDRNLVEKLTAQVIERLEKAVGRENAIEIMKSCGRKCCGQGQRNTAKRLMGESESIEEFLDRISRHDVKEGDLTYVLEDESTIIAEHNRCFCGQVKRTKKPFSTSTYCQCSVEFNRAFFEAALERPVQVELVQSIIGGAESCKFIVRVLA